MAENSGIEWTDHTFNPWIGCTKVSPACDFCYAEQWDKRYEGGLHWGAKAPRRRTSIANWAKPLKWNKKAELSGVRFRVFCASLADVFDNKVPEEWRADLWDIIKKTPHLDWLLLTKRPQNIKKMLPDDWSTENYPNVWLGTTVENQEEAEKRIIHLLNISVSVRFLSCEPLLGCTDLRRIKQNIDGEEFYFDALADPELSSHIHWVIAGGESGANSRISNPNWFRFLREQCEDTETAFFFKQWGDATPKIIDVIGRELDGVIYSGYPNGSQNK